MPYPAWCGTFSHMPETTNLHYESRGGAAVARITTPTVSERESPGLLNDLSILARSHGGRVVLDLSEVMMVTSAGMGMFIGLRKVCVEVGGSGKVHLVHASENIQTLLGITKLQKFFPMASSVDVAVASFG